MSTVLAVNVKADVRSVQQSWCSDKPLVSQDGTVTKYKLYVQQVTGATSKP